MVTAPHSTTRRKIHDTERINEIKRRFRADKSAISRIYGCYVNTKKEIVSYLDTSLGLLPEEEVEMYLGAFSLFQPSATQ